jgi:TonB-dependent receptor
MKMIFRIALVNSAALSALCAGAAHAQQADTATPSVDQPNEVIVTGYRQSLEQAIDIKRKSSGTVDAITADDMGSFPEDNLAEAMERLPGITIQRSNGSEGSQVQIRGLPSKYAQSLLNGMQAASGGAVTGSAGSIGSSRTFDYSILASELFNEVTVTKTPSADIIEGGIGGTIDIRTPSAFSYDKPVFIVNAQGIYNSLSDSMGEKVSGLAAHQFMNGRLRVAVSAAYSERTGRQDAEDSAGWVVGNVKVGSTTYNNIYYDALPRLESDIRQYRRIGLTGNVGFEISSDWNVDFDAIHSYQHTDYGQYQFMFPIKSAAGVGSTTSKADGVLTGAVVGGINGDTLVQADVSGTGLIRSNSSDYVYHQNFDMFTGTLKGKLLGFNLVARGGYSAGTTAYDVSNSAMGLQTKGDGFSVDFRPGNYTVFDVTDGLQDANNAAAWTPFSSTVTQAALENQAKEYMGQIDLSHDLIGKGAWKSIAFGVRYHDLNQTATSLSATSRALTAAEFQSVLTQTPFDNFMNGLGNRPAGFPNSWTTVDFEKMRELIGTSPDIPVGNADFNSSDYKNNYIADERTWDGYAMAVFDGTFLGKNWVGNIGVRAVSTTTSITNYLKATAGEPVLSNSGDSNLSFFPSLNLRWAPVDNVYLRASAGRSMTRPDLANLAKGGVIDPATLTVTQGNPGLAPTTANSVDFGAEWYFHRNALLSVAGFYKQYNGAIVTSTVQQDITYLGVTDSYSVSTPINSATPYNVYGVEADWQQPWYFMPGNFLKHFGHILNFTYVTSNTNQDSTPGYTHGMPGLSPYSGNAILYYQDSRISLRAAYNYRGRYYQSTSSSLPIYQDAYGQLDLSAYYTFNKNVQLRVQLANLTDAKDHDFAVAPDKLVHYGITGRTVYFGVKVGL